MNGNGQHCKGNKDWLAWHCTHRLIDLLLKYRGRHLGLETFQCISLCIFSCLYSVINVYIYPLKKTQKQCLALILLSQTWLICALFHEIIAGISLVVYLVPQTQHMKHTVARSVCSMNQTKLSWWSQLRCRLNHSHGVAVYPMVNCIISTTLLHQSKYFTAKLKQTIQSLSKIDLLKIRNIQNSGSIYFKKCKI